VALSEAIQYANIVLFNGYHIISAPLNSTATTNGERGKTGLQTRMQLSKT
jgi:hypothetical protein